MTIEHRPISPIRQRMIEDMRLRKLYEKTKWILTTFGMSYLPQLQIG